MYLFLLLGNYVQPEPNLLGTRNGQEWITAATVRVMLSRLNYMEGHVLEKKEEEVVMMSMEYQQHCIRYLAVKLYA